MSESYHPRVRELFSHPRHAGQLLGSEVRSGRAGGRRHGIAVVLWLAVHGDTVREARFQAFACPHTIAAAELLCQRLTGRRLGEGHFDARAVAVELDVPVEKLGRLLLLEDALAKAVG